MHHSDKRALHIIRLCVLIVEAIFTIALRILCDILRHAHGTMHSKHIECYAIERIVHR